MNVRNTLSPRDPRALILSGCIILALAASSGCRSKGTQNPQEAQDCERVESPSWPLRVFLQPSQSMNPDANGNPLDTQLRFFQVSQSKTAMAVTSVTQLWDEKAATEIFGDTLLKQDDQIAYIGRPYAFELQLDPASTHLLAAGLLRNTSGQDFMRELALPINYTKNKCVSEASKAPPPCLFVLVEDRRVLVSYTPPIRFSVRGIPVEQCPTKTELFPSVARKAPTAR